MKNTEENRLELPEGYQVEERKGDFILLYGWTQVAVLTEDGRLLSSAKKHHHAALAAFLQGAK